MYTFFIDIESDEKRLSVCSPSSDHEPSSPVGQMGIVHTLENIFP